MLSLQSQLKTVTVYREGAVCVRSAIVVPTESRVFRFGRLPLSVEPGSLRARVLNGRNRVVDVRADFDVDLAHEIDVPAEQRALEEAQAVLARLERARNRLALEIDELQSLRPSFLETKRGMPPRPAPVEAMLALGDFADDELSLRNAHRRELDRQLDDAKAQLILRQRRLAEASTTLSPERSKLSRAAVVTLAEVLGETTTIEFEYQVPGARWVPSYSLSLEPGLASGALHMRAAIVQNTGEDWTQVKLSLSTALRASQLDCPELKSLRIGRSQPLPVFTGWRAPPQGLDVLFEDYDSAFGPTRQPDPRPLVVARPKPTVVPLGAAAPMMQLSTAPLPSASGGAPPPMMAPSAPAPQKVLSELRRRQIRDDLDETESELDSSARVELAQDMDDSGLDEPMRVEPESRIETSLNDYSQLVMGPPDTAKGRRGRLVPANKWQFSMTSAVDVQVEVVMDIVHRALQQAEGVSHLPLPTACCPVTSVDAFDYRYACAASIDIPSKPAWTTVPVMTCDVGLTPEYICVPSVEPQVYRTLNVANRSLNALLEGPVDVMAGSEFLMTTQLPSMGPGSNRAHRLGLGVEERIKVARTAHFKETSGGFLGGSTVLPHDVEIELHNHLSAPALVEIRERVPVPDPKEKDVKVEELQVTPPWETIEGPIDGTVIKGARRWQVVIDPGAHLRFTAQYAIRIPADRMLVGGNRRN